MGRGPQTLVVFLCITGGFDRAAAQAPQNPPLEFSCAAFPAPVTEVDLIERFGADAVVTDSIVGADDGPFLGTVVHPSSEELTFEVAWSNTDPRRANWMRLRGPHASWTTSRGLRVGQDLRSVEEANGGRPFRLRGFDGEGSSGGSVLSWGGGRLAGEADELGSGTCEERIVFQPPHDGTAPFDALRQVRSLDEVSSGHPAMQLVNPRIVAVWLSYPR